MNLPRGSEYVLELLRIDDGTGNDVIRGHTWMQKMMYACSKAHPEMDYGFVPYRYGMYSERLVGILDNLKEHGLICMEKTAEDQRSPIHLTEAGREIADCLPGCTPDVLTTLRSAKLTLNRLSYNELVALAYTKFPEMREKSEQVDKYEEWRENAALTMVRAGKISRSLGASVAGLNEEEFDDRLGTLFASQASYHIDTWDDEDGRIVVKCLDIDGVVTDGENYDAALANITEAISAYLESCGVDRQFNIIPELRW